jgi:nitroreductase
MTDRPALTIDQLLSTTRAVRRRLDVDATVELETVLDCIRLAVQAPTGSGREGWRWVVVLDEERRAAVAGVYRRAARDRFERTAAAAPGERTRRLYRDAVGLADRLHRVPVLVIPCIEGRVDGAGNDRAAGFYGSILPAVWSFQLALRSRGLGSCWTSVHLKREREMGELLGIPDSYTQVALLPVAATVGSDFRPAARAPVEQVVDIDAWGAHPVLREGLDGIPPS